MSIVALLFALPVVAAGAWYLTASSPTGQLAEHEGDVARTRSRLRRINGMIMIASGILLYIVISRASAMMADDQIKPGLALPLACIALGPMTIAMLILAYFDMRLTRRLRQRMMGTAAREAKELWEQERLKRGLAVAAMIALLPIAAGCDEPATSSEPAQSSAVQQRMQQQQQTIAEERAAMEQRQAERDEAGQPQTLPTMELNVGEETLVLMIADDPDKREIGLMFRREMKPNEGMIFAFPSARPRSFWMRSTPLPLDLIYLNERGQVLNIGKGRPHDESSIPSRGPAKWCIELNEGRSEAIGIRPGTQFSVDKLPTAEE